MPSTTPPSPVRSPPPWGLYRLPTGRALAGLDELPPQVGLLSLRYLIPVMHRLGVGSRLNLITAEAVAAASVLGGGIRVTTEAPFLRSACQVLAIDLVVISA